MLETLVVETLLLIDHTLPLPRCLYGGAGRNTQIMQIMKAPHIVVATPGRLIDFAEGGELDLTKVRGGEDEWRSIRGRVTDFLRGLPGGLPLSHI